MKSRPKVINIDCLNPANYGYERKRVEALGAELVLQKAQTEDEIIRVCGDAEVILVERSETPLTARVIAQLKGCRAIVKYGVGIENIDLTAASRHGIVVGNAGDYCTEEVSDHTVALLLASARRILSMDRHVRAGGWSDIPRDEPFRRISLLTLGLMGVGRIGRAVVRKMSGFRMRMLAVDPYAPQAADSGVELVSAERLLRESDLISVHTPLTPETKGLIGEAAFRSMKPTAILVNTSRGGVVDQNALINALREKRIAGAALDVFAEEPLPASSPLREFGNVILTPHYAASSDDSEAQLQKTVGDSAAAVLMGHWPPFPVNADVKPRTPLKPWSEVQAALMT